MSEALIKVEHVSKKFCRSLKRGLWYGVQDIGNELLGRNKNNIVLRKNEFWAVKDASFEVKRGECLSLIGHNGAGKSTLLKMLNGLIRPDVGKIELKGRVGALIELGAGFNPVLTGRENIYVNGSILGLSQQEIDKKIESIIEFAEIKDFINTPVQYYSSGMKVRLGFAIASQMEPDILIIDEVLAVGDLGFRVKCLNRISEMIDQTAVVFVSHQMSQISRVSDLVILMQNGKVEFQGEDVAYGIQLYNIKFQQPKSKAVFKGKIRVDDFVIDNNKNVPFKYDEKIPVTIKLGCDQDFGACYIVLTFSNQSGIIVASLISDIVHFKNGKNNDVALNFPNTFNRGEFDISLTVLTFKKNRREILTKHTNLGRITSVGGDFDIGDIPLRINGNWTIKNNNNNN